MRFYKKRYIFIFTFVLLIILQGICSAREYENQDQNFKISLPEEWFFISNSTKENGALFWKMKRINDANYIIGNITIKSFPISMLNKETVFSLDEFSEEELCKRIKSAFDSEKTYTLLENKIIYVKGHKALFAVVQRSDDSVIVRNIIFVQFVLEDTYYKIVADSRVERYEELFADLTEMLNNFQPLTSK
ncbi:hypothetical protein [Propionispora hippei]|uniref:PsbP protein n=1 Tax=Propionispora hippei DSM 15287 TaxID=1123003 RepID=A0A1M6DY02_9FIRM|nr:hypothetical protein [Propionispora hippei]SHI78082.1 hypothetical protein SAMN02745170_01047 [Propionispora hippei DSM 15287]